jgi:hypothetical protein
MCIAATSGLGKLAYKKVGSAVLPLNAACSCSELNQQPKQAVGFTVLAVSAFH